MKTHRRLASGKESSHRTILAWVTRCILLLCGLGSFAFGQGPHACIGAALTLLEAQTVFSQVIDRWPDLALAEPNAAAWTGKPLYRGLTELRLNSAGPSSRSADVGAYTAA